MARIAAPTLLTEGHSESQNRRDKVKKNSTHTLLAAPWEVRARSLCSIDGTGLSRYTWMRERIYRHATEPKLFDEAAT